jgi:hypothetical protein
VKSLARVLPLYVLVFIGFVGYSLMIRVFAPLLLGALAAPRGEGGRGAGP